MSDAKIEFTQADHTDPERRRALRIVNYLGNMEAGKCAAVYAMAMQMSFRNLDHQIQKRILQAVLQGCVLYWNDDGHGEIENPCPTCKGIGTVGKELTDMKICEACDGTGIKTET